MRKIVTYGTLKRGFYNYNRFNQSFNFEFLSSEILKGFSLYDLGYYPAAVQSNDEIVVEVFEVSDECFNLLDRMEISAGYIKKEVETSVGCAIIWVMTEQQIAKTNSSKIESGNYVLCK